MTGLVIRPFVPADLVEALSLQELSYPSELRDAEAAFASRLDAGARSCWVAERDGQLCGYLLAHPWPSRMPPSVDAILAAPSIDDDLVLYVHDLSVSSSAKGGGLGRRLFECARDAAQRDGLARAELIAVSGARGFWQQMGFLPLPVTALLAGKIRDYGQEAVYMGRTL